MAEIARKLISGGRSEGPNIYKVCEKVIGQGAYGGIYKLYRKDTFVYYDSVAIDENADLVLSGEHSIEASEGNYTGKYRRNVAGYRIYKISNAFKWSNDDGCWKCSQYEVVVENNVVKYGVNDDPPIYASEVKGTDGYYRINYSL